METFPEEVLLPPSPLLILSSVTNVPILSALSSNLRSIAPFGSPSSSSQGGQKSNTVQLRFETHTPSSATASTLYKPPRKHRSHAPDFYESYTPSGLLRHNWLSKHQNDVPSVVALVFDTLDPRQTSPADWSANETTAAGAYAQLRESCRESRGQDIVVVLIIGVRPGTDEISPSGTGGSTNQNEMITSLKRRLKDAGLLDASLICTVTGSEIFSGGGPSLSALEAVLRDRSLSYYQNQTRRLKRTLSLSRFQPTVGQGGQTILPPPSTTTIRARLTIKVAHFQEFRGKNLKALKYYTQAFTILQNASTALLAAATQPRPPAADAVASALMELRAVVDFVSFKVMQVYLSFGHSNVPSGIAPGLTGAQAAVMHFQSHVKSFEFATLLPMLQPAVVCSHWAWMSRQYLVCAEMLQLRLPRPGLEARPQHVPSYYFHTAALHATRRRKAAESAGIIATASAPFEWPSESSLSSFLRASDVPLVSITNAEVEVAKWNRLQPTFFGGRPRLELKTPPIDNLSSSSSSAGAYIAALTIAESQVRHTDSTISLLEKSQALALLDGGVGSSSTSSNESFARGSCFTYNLTQSSSRSRIWRQFLVAEELFVGAKHEPAGKLLLPVSARLKHDKWWAVLVRVTSRLRDCATILRDRNLFAKSVLDLLSLSTHTSVSKVEALHIQLEQAMKDISEASLRGVRLLPVSLSRSPPLHISPKHLASRSTEMIPLHAQEAMQLADAPLLSVIVSFGRRLHRKNGEGVPVRIIISSNFPREVRLSVLRIRFKQFSGDFTTTAILEGKEIVGSTSAFDLTINHSDSNNDGIKDEDGVERLTTHPGPTSLLSNANLVLSAHGSSSFEYFVSVPIPQRLVLKDKTSDAAILAIKNDREINQIHQELSESVVCESVEAEWTFSLSGKADDTCGILFHLWPRTAVPSFGTPMRTLALVEQQSIVPTFAAMLPTLARSVEPCVAQVSQTASAIKRLEDHVYAPRGSGLSHAESHKHFRHKRAPPPVIVIPAADKTALPSLPNISQKFVQDVENDLAQYMPFGSDIFIRKARGVVNVTDENASREGRICGKQADFFGTLALTPEASTAYVRLEQDSETHLNQSKVMVSVGCRTKLRVNVGNSGGFHSLSGGVLSINFSPGSSLFLPKRMTLVNLKGENFISSPESSESLILFDSSSVLGVFIPPIPNGIEFSFPIMVEIPYAEASAENDHPHHFLSVNMYLARGSQSEKSWIELFAKSVPPVLNTVIVVREKWILFPKQPFKLTTSVRSDPSFPTLDISLLDGGVKPFVLSNSSDSVSDLISTAEIPPQSGLNTLTPRVFKRSPFLVSLSLMNDTMSSMWLTDVSYDPDGGAQLLGCIADQIFSTLSSSNFSNDEISTALCRSLNIPCQESPMKSNVNKYCLKSRNDIELLLSSPPLCTSNFSGRVSLGTLRVSFTIGDDSLVRNSVLHLGYVDVSDDIIDCSISVPDIVNAGRQVPISIRLENLTAHFQCLEVSSSLPSLEEAQHAGVERFELADRFNRYTVELLPYSEKKLSFTVIARNPGWCLLPLILIRSSGIQSPLSVTLPRAILVSD